MIKRYMQLTLAALLLTGAFLAAEKASTIPAAAKKVADSFDTNRMKTDLNFLASDLLEGRGTGQRGGDIAAAYIAAQFQIAGLNPAGENGTYMQMVPLNGVTAQPESTLKISAATGEPIQLKYLDDFVANPYSQKTEEPINGPLVFVGYGVNAPEFGWNDYAGLDAHGKVVLALVNDPPSQDPKFFGGKAMTYYGRWTYKYEEAARQGAAGILLIHNTDMASYGWNVVRNSWSGEQAFLANPPGQYALPMAGWIQEDVAKKIASAAGTDLNALFDKAKTKGFKPVELPLKIEGKIIAKTRPLHA
ncbi:peptidase M28, partial [bacterium]|nr:peptidase M28 [bacterium]